MRKKFLIEAGIPADAMRKQLIVALDLDLSDPKVYARILSLLKKKICAVKIGLGAFSLGGPSLLAKAEKQGIPIFLDLKFLDIPNTVAMAAACMAKLGIWMFTVHTLGGAKMLEMARSALDRECEKSKNKRFKRPLMMGVTILTSEEASTKELRRRARLAQDHGCDGVICSALDLKDIREECGEEFITVTPGLRLPDENSQDQVRVATPQEALLGGADYLVMGRTILKQILKA